jgi:hypothetical protein
LSINFIGNRTSRFPSVDFEGCKVIALWISRLLEFRRQGGLAPFGPKEGFQGPDHMKIYLAPMPTLIDLGQELVKAVGMSPWYLG